MPASQELLTQGSEEEAAEAARIAKEKEDAEEAANDAWLEKAAVEAQAKAEQEGRVPAEEEAPPGDVAPATESLKNGNDALLGLLASVDDDNAPP